MYIPIPYRPIYNNNNVYYNQNCGFYSIKTVLKYNMTEKKNKILKSNTKNGKNNKKSLYVYKIVLLFMNYDAHKNIAII